ncbi:MAG: hypothetical protein V4634_20020 [Pseudomonadota bacterium]
MSKQFRKQGSYQGSPETDMHEQHVKAEQQRHQHHQQDAARQAGAQASKDSRGQPSPNSDSARAVNDGLDDRYFSKTESKRDSSKDQGKNR